MKWLRSFAGIGAGALNLLANGTNWKQVLVSVGLASIGVVAHVTSVDPAPLQPPSQRLNQ